MPPYFGKERWEGEQGAFGKTESSPPRKMKKIPLRMCSGCGEMKGKKELVRVVKNKEGEISLDLTGKKAGRGAYVCPSLDCLKKARKTRKIERSFSCKIPDELYDQMEAEMRKHTPPAVDGEDSQKAGGADGQ